LLCQQSICPRVGWGGIRPDEAIVQIFNPKIEQKNNKIFELCYVNNQSVVGLVGVEYAWTNTEIPGLIEAHGIESQEEDLVPFLFFTL
jgi:hypothetical protein